MDFSKPFDVFLTELTPPTKDSKGPVVAGSRFIGHGELEKLAAKEGCEIRNLPLSRLRGRLSGGVFCLESNNMAELDGSIVLSEYAKLQTDQPLDTEIEPVLTVYWTRKYTHDLKERFDQTPDPKKPSGDGTKPPARLPEIKVDYQPALDSPTKIPLPKPTKVDTPYDLSAELWAKVIDGNRLLYGFQSDQSQIESLTGMALSAYLAPGWQANVPEPPPAPGPPAPANPANPANPATPPTPTVETIKPPGINITSTTNLSTYGPFTLSISPLFRANPNATLPAKSNDDVSETKSSDLLWSNSKSVSTTMITKIQHSLDQWSTESGMSKNSANAGLSIPIGKASLGAKFGFERETSHSSKTSTKSDESCYTASHIIPTADIVLNETTLLVTHDAEANIRRLRKKRNFGDLLLFYKRYGTIVYQNVTLGGRLYHTRQFSKTEAASEYESSKKFSVSASASLGIPDIIDFNAGGSHEQSSSKGDGSTTTKVAENLQWTGFGGNPSLVVDPPQWRDSLNDYKTWKPIQYENPILIQDLLGKIPGFSDIPVLFSDILASGVLDTGVLALPPNSNLQLGMSVDPKTGAGKAGTPPTKIETTLEAPSGFSWNILSDARDLKNEIRANLQQTLNPVVNLSVDTPFLADIKADQDIFTLILRWNSPTVKHDWPADGTEATAKKTALAADPSLAQSVFVSSLTSRSWVIGVWQIRRTTMAVQDFDDMKSGFIKHFSDPQSIAGGCDYINKMFSAGDLGVLFYLYASDGPSTSEVKVLDAQKPTAAFNFIDQRMNLSSIHMLPVKAEIESFTDGSPLPSVLNEVVLLETQEARASLAFLGTFSKPDPNLANQITKFRTDHLFDTVVPLSADGLTELTAINSELQTLELAVVS